MSQLYLPVCRNYPHCSSHMAQTAARADSVAFWFWAEAEAAMAAVTVAAATVAAANRDAITITKPPVQPR